MYLRCLIWPQWKICRGFLLRMVDRRCHFPWKETWTTTISSQRLTWFAVSPVSCGRHPWMDTLLMHSSGLSVKYMASLIICSPTSSNMEEVTCLIKVVGEILLIAWGFLLLLIRTVHWSYFPQILSVRSNAMWSWHMQVAEPLSNIISPDDILACRRLYVVSILMKSSQEQWHEWAAGLISDDHNIWMMLTGH